MVMQEQAKRLREPLPWGRRQKAVVAVMISSFALALIGLLVYGLTTKTTTRPDCVSVTFASTLGGAALKGCGAHARKICAHGDAYPALQKELRLACAKAGFAFKS